MGAKPPPEAGRQSGDKKRGGWGEGIFARLFQFPFRLNKRKAEGGFRGNSARRLARRSFNAGEAQPVPFGYFQTDTARNRKRILKATLMPTNRTLCVRGGLKMHRTLVSFRHLPGTSRAEPPERKTPFQFLEKNVGAIKKSN